MIIQKYIELRNRLMNEIIYIDTTTDAYKQLCNRINIIHRIAYKQ